MSHLNTAWRTSRWRSGLSHSPSSSAPALLRALGSRCRHSSTNATGSGAVPSGGAGMGSSQIALQIAMKDVPLNGCAPRSISSTMTPTDHTSLGYV